MEVRFPFAFWPKGDLSSRASATHKRERQRENPAQKEHMGGDWLLFTHLLVEVFVLSIYLVLDLDDDRVLRLQSAHQMRSHTATGMTQHSQVS